MDSDSAELQMLLSVQIQPIKWLCSLPGGLLEILLFVLI